MGKILKTISHHIRRCQIKNNIKDKTKKNNQIFKIIAKEKANKKLMIEI